MFNGRYVFYSETFKLQLSSINLHNFSSSLFRSLVYIDDPLPILLAFSNLQNVFKCWQKLVRLFFVLL